jgi:hypothetical protein
VLVSLSQKRDSLLSKAYNAKSSLQLELFFKNWLLETSAISDADFKNLNDTIQNVYLVFQNFYNPIDINKTGGSEWGNDIYKNVKYLLVQDKIEYGFVDTLDRELLIQTRINRYTKGDTAKLKSLLKRYKGDMIRFKDDYLDWPEAKEYSILNDFHPKFEFSEPAIVFLTDTYEKLINDFLGDNNYKLGEGNIMSPARSKGESENRQKFLENYIKIWYGHWGGYWQLNSYPFAEKITFDTKFENAVVNYRMVYEGGYAYFKKINGKWTLLQAKRTWIE